MNNKLDYIAIDFETSNQYRNSACSVSLSNLQQKNGAYSVEELLKACGSQIRTF